MQTIYWFFASAQMSFLTGFIAFIYLLYLDRKHKADRKLDRFRVAASMTLVAMAYTIIVIVVGHFIFGIKTSMTISQGFGDDRVAWLLLALWAYVFKSCVELFDPVKT